MHVRRLFCDSLPFNQVRVILSILFLTNAQLALADGEKKVDYIRDVRPILSNNCFKCHGPDEAARKAELRLDTEEDALADRGGYRAIDRDDPAASEVLIRITSADEEERMPPPIRACSSRATRSRSCASGSIRERRLSNIGRCDRSRNRPCRT